MTNPRDIGIILGVGWLVTILTYICKLNGTLKTYCRESQTAIDRIAPRRTGWCTASRVVTLLFFVLESLYTVEWVYLSLYLSGAADNGAFSYRSGFAYYGMMVSAIVFIVSSATWALVIPSGARNVFAKYPAPEEAALLGSACGALSMLLFTITGSETDNWPWTTLLLTGMTFHTVIVDLIGWSFIRYNAYQQHMHNQQMLQDMSSYWDRGAVNQSLLRMA